MQGAILVGMGSSAFLFNLLATRLINPAGLNAPFPPEVAARWPSLLRTLGVSYACLALAGAALQSNPPSAAIRYPLLERLRARPRLSLRLASRQRRQRCIIDIGHQLYSGYILLVTALRTAQRISTGFQQCWNTGAALLACDDHFHKVYPCFTSD